MRAPGKFACIEIIKLLEVWKDSYSLHAWCYITYGFMQMPTPGGDQLKSLSTFDYNAVFIFHDLCSLLFYFFFFALLQEVTTKIKIHHKSRKKNNGDLNLKSDVLTIIMGASVPDPGLEIREGGGGQSSRP